MGRLPKDFAKSGYNQEEAYFHEMNQKLIQTQRKQRDRRAEQVQSSAKVNEIHAKKAA